MISKSGSMGEGLLRERYVDFVSSPVIRGFLAAGGRVFLACEGRAASDIAPLISAGHRHFAEKFVQGVCRKWPSLPRESVVLHGYGHLQTNKSRKACTLFDAIESVGRKSLCERLKALQSDGVEVPPVYLQVNTGGEPQKGGFVRHEAPEALAQLRRAALTVLGVMAIPPREGDAAEHFRWLRRFAERESLHECVMGMSADYRVAIREGATAIRIGRAVFGEAASLPS